MTKTVYLLRRGKSMLMRCRGGDIRCQRGTEMAPPCQNIQVGTDGNCQGTATAAQVNNGSNDPGGSIQSMVLHPAGPYPIGINGVWLVVTDNGGLMDSCNATVTVRDLTPPTVNCPDDITVTAAPGQSSAIVNYIASAADPCGLGSFNCVPPSGSAFPIGTTTVTCTVIDAAGNTASCSFDVTVNPPVADADVAFDIKPRSCPNAVNVDRNWQRSNAVLPVAILGTADFDVHDIDPASLRLEGVAPLRWSFEDVSRPVSDPEDCECTTAGPDGHVDLTVKFRLVDILSAIVPLSSGDEPSLTITGMTTDGEAFSGADCILVRGDLSIVPKTTAAIPSDFGLTNHPNPFNAGTVIQYNLPEDGAVQLEVYNILGQSLGVLVNEFQSAGPHSIAWDGRDDHGSPAPSGLYLYRLQTGSQIETRKMVLLK